MSSVLLLIDKLLLKKEPSGANLQNKFSWNVDIVQRNMRKSYFFLRLVVDCYCKKNTLFSMYPSRILLSEYFRYFNI